jgi:molecular chaperone DnaJ
MAGRKDYYEILGVSRDASEKDLKAAYRKLARKYHPDVNPGDKHAEERFKEIAEAFAVLSDPEKRAQYDRGGHDAFGPGFDPFGGAGFDIRDFGLGDLSDLFEMFGAGAGGRRGGRRGTSRAHRGEDIEFEIGVPFVDAARGTTLEIRLPRQTPCSECGGAGTRSGSQEIQCPDCMGAGRQDQRRGPMQVSVTCPRCGGSGRLRGSPCDPCGGSGRRGSEEKIKVRIPAGIEDGGRVRLAGKGNAGTLGGPAGDAYLRIRVEAHPTFRRDGRDLSCDVSIGIARAALGGTIEVPTLDGKASITVPPGTRSGQRFRLRGKGVGAGNGKPAGDLYAVISIVPPKKLDDRSQELLEEFDRLNPDA